VLVATFGPGTGWAGKKITHEDGQFVLEGSGPVSAAQVVALDRAVPLVWAVQGTRAWVGSLAQSGATPPVACWFDRAHYVCGPPELGAAVDGRLWVTAEYVGVQVADGSVVASLRMASLAGVRVLGEQVATSPVVATVSVGNVSLGAKGSIDRTFLVACPEAGGGATYAIDRMSPDKVRAAVGPVLALAGVPFAGPPAGPPAPGMIDEVERLATQHAEGSLSDAEFRALLGPVVTEAAPAEETGAAPGPRPVPRPAVDAAVERLTALRLAGSITDAEFSAMKAKLLE
jgi:hypothetical protein